MIFEHSSYRSYLRAVLADRMRRNPSYSTRAMARQLGIVISQLSEVLNEKANFSTATTRKVARNLGLEVNEAEYFCQLVQYDQESDPELRQLFLERINRVREAHSQKAVHDLTIDQFKQIAEWHHSAILELVRIPGYERSPARMAKALGISELQATVALERLERLGLLDQDETGAWHRAQDLVRLDTPHRSRAINSCYRAMMEKASQALDEQLPTQERLGVYETLTFSEESLPEIREAMNHFCDEVVRISRKHPKRTKVYHFFAHFFNLTHEKKVANP